MSRLNLVDSVWRDLKYGMRQLRLHPAFALSAILSLALGIGANTAIFTLVDQILLRLLPVHNPRELVQLRLEGGRAGSQSGDGLHTFSYPLYVAFRDRNSVLAGLTGQIVDPVSLVGEDRSEVIRAGLVAGNFFQVLGVQPHLGRLLTADDSKNKNSRPVAVLQYDFWQNRFGGDRGIVGSTIRLNGSPFTVVGIAAPGFEGTDVGLPANVWAPITMKPTLTPPWDELENERYAWFYLFGRLKPGVSIGQAQAEIKVLYRQRQEEEIKADFFVKFPELKDRFLRGSPTLIPAGRGQSFLRFGFERPLIVLQWLVGFVLLIACTNVANLLLARAVARQREVAIRGALGASRGRLTRQLLIESLALAVAGGVAGLFLSTWVAKGLVQFLPFDPANMSLSTTPDLRILLFTAGIVLITAVLFGLIPALQGSRVSPGATLKEEAGAVAGGHGHVRLRKTLIGLQVALSCLLLIGAGLFARTIRNLQNVNLGFKTESVVMFGVRPAIIYDEARKRQVFRSLLESLATVPGVRAAGANSTRLLMGGRWDSSITIPGVEPKEGNQPWSFFNAITPGYFEALGIPIKAGRDLTWADWGGSRKLCLVNEALVREYLAGANPVGRLMAQGTRQTPDTEIIGVFADSKYHDVRGEVPRQTFVSLDSRLRFTGSMNVYARIQGNPRQVMSQLRDQVRRVDSNLVVSDIRMLNDQLNMRLANERMLSFLSAGFALLATLLAVVGLHGVLTFVVARRTREIGIRMALGAEQGNVIRLVLREMLLVIVLGIAAGVAAGLLCGRYVESQLFGVKAADLPVFAASVAAVLAASLGAALIPSWRASRLDPMRALRCE
jgi:predicted permease